MDEQGSGWLTFASIILVLAGIMRILDSIWAFRYKGALPENLNGGVLGTNLKTYAWVDLIVGIVLVLAGFYVLSRNQFFRWVGIVAGALAALSGVVWMPYYPVWGFLYTLLAVLVIYGLAAHGSREPAAR